MIKIAPYTFKGMHQDLSKSKHPAELYYEGKNIRVISTSEESTGSVTNDKGNELVLTIPTPVIDFGNLRITYTGGTTDYIIDNTIPEPRCEIEETYFISTGVYEISGVQKIIAAKLVRDTLIIFSTDDNGFDCIWEADLVNDTIDLKYMRDLGFSSTTPITIINNYENSKIDKIYWIDGEHQTRFINLEQSIANGDKQELIDLPSTIVNQVPEVTISQPEIITISKGGTHTSGMVQYAYNLYNLNGSQTTLSPLSELVSLDKFELGGGELNEIIGSSPTISITNIDTNFSKIRLYAIKYTSYGEIPSISLIEDSDINGNTLTKVDSGEVIESLSLDEFTFLGSDIIIPETFNVKDNRMFMANYKEQTFDIDTYGGDNGIDCRAFSFAENTVSVDVYDSVSKLVIPIFNDPETIDSTTLIGPSTSTLLDYKHSAINDELNVNTFQYNSSVIGGTGPFLQYELVRSQIGENGLDYNDTLGKFFKDDELYRLGIQFYNNYNQFTPPKWITDFIVKTSDVDGVDETNLSGYYATLKIEFTARFYTWLNDDNNFLDENGNFNEALKPVGYKVLRADRTVSDRSIICQGVINPMISYYLGDLPGSDFVGAIIPDTTGAFAIPGIKMPSFMRGTAAFNVNGSPEYGTITDGRNTPPIMPAIHFNRLDPVLNHFTGVYNPRLTEVYSGNTGDGKARLSMVFQYNKLNQLFSPEITFNIVQNFNAYNFKTIRSPQNTQVSSEYQYRNVLTQGVEGRALFPTTLTDGALTPPRSIIGAGFEIDQMSFVQMYRKYNSGYRTKINYTQIHKEPVVVEKGQDRTVYHDISELSFVNSLENITADINDIDVALLGTNSYGAKNVTLAFGDDNDDESTLKTFDVVCEAARYPVHANYQVPDKYSTLLDNCLMGELTIHPDQLYIGGLYGGNTFEAKKRTNYIEIGSYQPMSISPYIIQNPGDTFVSNFKFTKLVKTDTEVYSGNGTQITEIIDFPVETTVDLKNRNDLSINDWNGRFQPRDEEYQQYNSVYSQQANLLLRRDVVESLKIVDRFENRIISSRLKIPGETIDSWTDNLINETKDLDGKYGPINHLHSFRDELYTFQDRGFAFLSINPRIQTTTSDGLSLQLGVGRILDDYKYISTESGTLNPQSVVNGKTKLYYYDDLNKVITSFNGQSLEYISSLKGLHVHLTNKAESLKLAEANPLSRTGVVATHDHINDDILFSFLQDETSFTVSYNEKIGLFTSFYDFIPSVYASKSDTLLSTNPDNTALYKHFDGEYGDYYGTKHKSFITLKINPETNLDCVFNNIEFNSEVRIGDVDQPSDTMTSIRAWDDYQDTGTIPLIVKGNLKRKFRKWRTFIPRQQGTRNRIRNPWIYLKLEFDNTNNKKLVLHDILVHYTV